LPGLVAAAGAGLVDDATTYKVQHFASGDAVAVPQSIMFAESLRLLIHGENGSVTTELLTIGQGGPTIGRVASTGHEIDLREADNITFLLPMAGRLDIEVAGRTYAVPSRQLTAFRPADRRTRAIPSPATRFRAATIQVPLAKMQALALAAGSATDHAFAQDGIALTGDVGRHLSRSLPFLADDLLLRPQRDLQPKVALAIRQLIDDQLAEMIETKVAQPAWRSILPAFHRVRQAEELMYALSDEPISMLEIARTLGVGLRSLQLAFHHVHDGQSPRDILTRIRLEKARHRLLAANENAQVTTVALDSGFFHLSRFAQAYARTFGERPSETLARRRRA
jgi:AraC-like DNA-binding protein